MKWLTVFKIFGDGDFPCLGHRKKWQRKNQSRCVTLELRVSEEETYSEQLSCQSAEDKWIINVDNLYNKEKSN